MDALYQSEITDKLQEFGIETLTSESCAYGMRILCDVSPEGKEWLEEFFGVEHIQLSDAWNHNQNFGWGSIMLSRSDLEALCIFILLHQYSVIALFNFEKVGLLNHFRLYETGSEYQDNMSDHPFMKDCIVRVWYGQEQSRNKHQFSGRYS